MVGEIPRAEDGVRKRPRKAEKKHCKRYGGARGAPGAGPPQRGGVGRAVQTLRFRESDGKNVHRVEEFSNF